MKPIVLVHWNPKEAEARMIRLKDAGCRTRLVSEVSPGLLRKLTEIDPAAIIVDLSRRPSQGRELGVALRHRASTRKIPLIFAAGDEEKVAKIRQILSDAVFSPWEDIEIAIATAIAKAPEKPVVPASIFAGYAGTPLPKKLGIKPGFRVALVHPPENAEQSLGALPESVSFQAKADAKSRLILWFLKSRKELEREAPKIAAAAANQPVWIFWPKKTSGLAADLTQQAVREAGLAAGLVDYKICSFDSTWSGLLFRRRA